MRLQLYSRLARSGIRSNKQLYIPYIMTSVCMVTMYYIISSLSTSSMLLNMTGGDAMTMILSLGKIVIIIFSAIFLLYTNSFLIRRRKREFGLYNILGMNKSNVGIVISIESFYIYLISIVIGIGAGLLFSKLCELLLLRILSASVNYKMEFNLLAIKECVIVFAVISVMTLVLNLFNIKLSNPIQLLKSASVGEKAPKANWLLAVLGAVILGGAYYISVTINDPVTAIVLFFVAVVMVIIASYMLFIAGSVALCKLLQKNKSYYYKSSHFVSVSSMVYRMKRNGAGLASICILSTMVLVMLSSTSCLYIGGGDSVRKQYPYDFDVQLRLPTVSVYNEEYFKTTCDDIKESLPTAATEGVAYIYSLADGTVNQGGYINIDPAERENAFSFNDLKAFVIMPTEEYRALTGSELYISDDEALVYSDALMYPYSTVNIMGVGEKKAVITDEFTDILPSSYDMIVDVYYIFINDYANYTSELESFMSLYDVPLCQTVLGYGFNTELTEEQQLEVNFPETREYAKNLNVRIIIERQEENRVNFYSLYGSFFFLGIMLSLAFMIATVLIIYYKQISEGYEDKARFNIMQNVGMAEREIKRSINSQLLTVFFAPLIMAGTHLAFAFPMIYRMLQVLGVKNLHLLININLICFAVFALFYAVVYKLTSDTYFKIVCGKSKD